MCEIHETKAVTHTVLPGLITTGTGALAITVDTVVGLSPHDPESPSLMSAEIPQRLLASGHAQRELLMLPPIRMRMAID